MPQHTFHNYFTSINFHASKKRGLLFKASSLLIFKTTGEGKRSNSTQLSSGFFQNTIFHLKLNENAILVPSEFTAQVMPVAANANDMLLPITMGRKYLLENSLTFINIYCIGISVVKRLYPCINLFFSYATQNLRYLCYIHAQ